jgi:hypothetical protein
MTPERADARRFWDGKNLSETHKAAIGVGMKLAHGRKRDARNKVIRELLQMPDKAKPSRRINRHAPMLTALMEKER